jgi:excinuclease UvrABC nuclease subunit
VEAGEVAARLVAAGVAGPPALPGVYAFRDAAGDLLYVGTSADLARRVRSYFAPGQPAAGKAASVARLGARIEWRACGSVLEALVLEARTIGRERPHFNRRLKESGRHAYVRIDPRDPFPRLETVCRLDAGPWRHVGPLPGGRRLAAAVDRVADALGLRSCPGTLHPAPGARACLRLDLGQCTAPCIGAITPGAYGRRVVRALAALGGVDSDGARASEAHTGPAEVALPGPVAGALRALRSARVATRVIVVVPAAGAPGHRLLAVAGGRLREATAAPSPEALRAAFARVWAALEPPAPAILPRTALDEVRVVTAWLASAAGRAAAVDVSRTGRAAAWARVVARTVPGPLFSSAGRRAPA